MTFRADGSRPGEPTFARDLVLFDTTMILQQVMFGEIPGRVARFSPASVLVVKRDEGHMRSFLKRALG